MKKNFYLYVFIFIFYFIINVDNVIAEKIIRVYNEEYTIAAPFLIRYDTEQNKYELAPSPTIKDKSKEQITIDGIVYEFGTTSVGFNVSGITNFQFFLNDEPIKPITNDQALKLYYCRQAEEPSGQYSSTTYNVYIFYDSIQKSEFEKTKDIKFEDGECINLESNEAKKGEADSISSCNSYEGYTKSIEEKFLNYKNTKNNNYILAANKEIKKVTNLCRMVFAYVDYDDNCLNACLGLKKWLTDKKTKYGIENLNPSTSGCGFSEKLIQWIANIIRWVKYIAPVAVIVLGILDFMKAMSADKDDEMKKAQQRFIRRLIAAALIFIAPFIIEFILIKLGFAANGCGIINL